MTDDPNRREFVRRSTVAATNFGLVGAVTGAAGAQQNGMTPAPMGTEIIASGSNGKEGSNGNAAAIAVGYAGSQLQERWIDGELKERWSHAIEVSMSGACSDHPGGVCYNIDSQAFEARLYGDVEQHVEPNAGAASWPTPPGGNWSEASDAVVQNSLTTLSNLASVGFGAEDVIDAYHEENFDTSGSSNPAIEFLEEYDVVTRHTASHFVRMQIDQVPGGSYDGMVDMLAGVSKGNDLWETQAWAYVYPAGEDDANIVPDAGLHDSASKYRKGNKTLREKLDQMSRRELRERGIRRVTPAEIDANPELEQQAPFTLDRDRANYIASFPVEAGAGAGKRPRADY